MSAVEHFTQARPRLLRLAYSELGDVGEAEDVVQERGCGWSAPIENLGAWLTTCSARACDPRARHGCGR